MSGQSRKHSAFEAALNILIGYVIAYIASFYALQILGNPISHNENFWLTNIMTVVSFVRSYYIRRFFNWLHTER